MRKSWRFSARNDTVSSLSKTFFLFFTSGRFKLFKELKSPTFVWTSATQLASSNITHKKTSPAGQEEEARFADQSGEPRVALGNFQSIKRRPSLSRGSFPFSTHKERERNPLDKKERTIKRWKSAASYSPRCDLITRHANGQVRFWKIVQPFFAFKEETFFLSFSHKQYLSSLNRTRKGKHITYSESAPKWSSIRFPYIPTHTLLTFRLYACACVCVMPRLVREECVAAPNERIVCAYQRERWDGSGRCSWFPCGENLSSYTQVSHSREKKKSPLCNFIKLSSIFVFLFLILKFFLKASQVRWKKPARSE